MCMGCLPIAGTFPGVGFGSGHVPTKQFQAPIAGGVLAGRKCTPTGRGVQTSLRRGWPAHTDTNTHINTLHMSNGRLRAACGLVPILPLCLTQCGTPTPAPFLRSFLDTP